jgi:transcriptional regulator with GAF, ATPase, and Fis domain
MDHQILEFAERLLAETELSGILNLAMDQLVELSGAERGLIILFDNNGNISIETARNLAREDIDNPKFQISHTIINKVKTEGNPVCLQNALEDSSLNKSSSTSRLKILSVICLPLLKKNKIYGVVYLDNRKISGIFTAKNQQLVQSFAGLISLTAHKALEINSLHHRLDGLESELRKKFQFDHIIGHCPQMINVLKIVTQVANTDATILIYGESGTGKELIARSVHYNSNRKENKFIPLNCGALPEQLLESELFGHTRGAFTGALKDTAGWFEAANGGTIFLDEVSEMSPALQVKLLRVLQTGEYSRVGSTEISKTDVRIIAATNQLLRDLVANNSFRNDLYYRLNVIDIELPPLRNRKSDIPVLAQHFLIKFCKTNHKNNVRLSNAAEACLLNYSYPGNIRELENAIQRAVTLVENDIIEPYHFPSSICKNKATLKISSYSSLTEAKRKASEKAEKEYINDCLRATGGHVRNAAKMAGIDASNFHKMMKKHKIDYTEFKNPQ